MSTQRISGPRVLGVVYLSAATGFLVGLFPLGRWQIAVESAQVLAGVVRYPPENAFYMYHVKAWSLPHQLAAVCLQAGVSERVLSLIISGLLTALAFVGLALCAYALCRHALFAVLTPILVFVLFGARDQYGAVYPIHVGGTHHSYGVLGRYFALALLAAAALGCRRTAALGLGLFPALHLTWAAFTIAVMAVAYPLRRRPDRLQFRLVGPWLLVGASIAAISFAVQLYMARAVSAVSASVAQPFVTAFLEHWDYHRQPAPILSPAVAIAASILLLGFVAWRRGPSFDTPARRLLYALSIAAAFGIVGIVATHVSGILPDIIERAMPGRFINLAVAAAPAVIVGLCARLRAQTAIWILLLAILGYTIWNEIFEAFLSSDKYGWYLAHWKAYLVVACAMTVALMMGQPADPRHSESMRRRLPVYGAASVVLFLAVIQTWRETAPGQSLIVTPTDSVFASARQHSGMLASSGHMELVQLRTRRPLLLNTGGLDQIVMVPESGPAMAESLRDVYGIDLVSPPTEIRDRRPGALLRDSARELWEGRTPAEWATIGERYGITQLIVYADWRIALPVTARSDDYVLYQMPRSPAPLAKSNPDR